MPAPKPETILKKRIKELKAIFADLDENKMKIVIPTIYQAAKMEPVSYTHLTLPTTSRV